MAWSDLLPLYNFTISLYPLKGYPMKPIPARCLLQTAILLTVVWAHPAFSASFSLNPSADAFVTTGPSGSLSNNNYGGAGALSVAGAGQAKGEFQSLLKFNLAGAKSSFDTQLGIGTWTVQSVTLRLTATSPRNAIFNTSSPGLFVISRMQNDGWLEGSGTPKSITTAGITFSTLNNFVGPTDEALGNFQFNGATSGNFTYSLPLSSLFSDEILSGSTLSLRLRSANNAVSYLFNSRNFGTASQRPLLTITAVPEPGMLSLFSLFLPLVFCRRWLQAGAGRLQFWFSSDL
jgi:hypothetical protein